MLNIQPSHYIIVITITRKICKYLAYFYLGSSCITSKREAQNYGNSELPFSYLQTSIYWENLPPNYPDNIVYEQKLYFCKTWLFGRRLRGHIMMGIIDAYKSMLKAFASGYFIPMLSQPIFSYFAIILFLYSAIVLFYGYL